MCHLKQIILLYMAANSNNLKGDKHGFQCRSLSFVQWVDYRDWGLFFSLFSFLKFHSSLIGPLSCLSDLTAASDWSLELSFWPDSCLWLVLWAVFLTWQRPLIGPLTCLFDLTAAFDWSTELSFWPDWGLIGPLHFLFNLTAASDWSIEMSFWSDRPLCLVVIIFMKILW